MMKPPRSRHSIFAAAFPKHHAREVAQWNAYQADKARQMCERMGKPVPEVLR